MQRSRLGAIALGTSALLGAALASPALAATDSEIPTFQEFHASTFKDADQQYIVNGDEPVASTGELKDFYDRMVGGSGDPWRTASSSTPSAASTTSGRTAQVGNLTYCVSDKFGARKADIVNAMNGGAGLWEGAAAADQLRLRARRRTRAAPRATTSVLFSVEPVQTTQYIARAFFPSTPKRSRNVLVDDSIWTSGSLDPEQHPRPRARPHAGLPPRAHPPRGRHLLRGQQLAPADAVRLGVDHALPAVQRLVEQPVA